ncbi:GIY-YIG nuclease family protein [Actinosynnema sp. NPDC047251]|uniref:Uncharacterized protein n=1 Tax=Saccharothrix espanaensis (strain ATCC 51144 / DSM 44229 / JCM 9112 / NBRC 15066 / NRRL 15764) TaxID=1179773 RepID=K0JUU3_SACES|nr:GIY-YIG nuclease family protein [Saccharothrix espanaensis]CCH29731.1 hypothetical protein BN6_24170 [Saccharothrix espanaensis DSM 44229]
MSVHEFAKSLRTLHVECGKPSYHRIRGLAPEHALPPATVSEVLNGKRLPKAEFMQAFVRALLRHRDGGDTRRHDEEVARWRRKWQHAVLSPRSTRSLLDRGLSARDESGGRWGDAEGGCYALYGPDGEAVYIGQTDANLGTAVRARLALLLDPVAEVELWPAPRGRSLDVLERAVYRKALGERADLPPSHRFPLTGEDGDVRIARRAAELARLAASVVDGDTGEATRRALAVEATRLARLAVARFARSTGRSAAEVSADLTE